MKLSTSDTTSLFDPALVDDPYPTYRAVQAAKSLYFDAEHHAWVVTRYSDAVRLLKEPATYSSRRPLSSSPDGLGYNFMLFCQDPPDHTKLRAFIKRAFTTSRLTSLSDWIKYRVDNILDALPASQFDLAEKLAIPLPIMVVTRMLGIADQHWSDLKLWTEMTVGHHNADGGYPGRRAFMQLHALFKQEIEKRRTVPGNDIISDLVYSNVDGRKLEDIEIVNFCTTLLIAGNETTASLISNTVNILVDRPQLWANLRRDRSLVPAVIEESLRYDSPVQFISRKVVKDTSIRGQLLAAGDNVIICLGAANRDPDEFCRAREFVSERKEKHHLAFSHGIHFCIGAALTRLETKIVLNGMLDRYESMERVAPGIRYSNSFFRGFREFAVRVSSAAY